MNYDEKCQILIIGDSTVGKTSLLYRYTEDKYSSQYLATVGIDFFTKDENFSGKMVRIKVWDTAGQERYKSLTQAFFRNAHGIILVFDVTNLESFSNLKYWIQSINMHLGEKHDMKMIIIGNKIDLSREISKEDAENFAKQANVPYYETSAKNGTGINESIRALVCEILKDKMPTDKKDSVRLSGRTSGGGSGDSKCKC
jgi:small GTP-binding protein